MVSSSMFKLCIFTILHKFVFFMNLHHFSIFAVYAETVFYKMIIQEAWN